jgi:hypothetical protein
MTAGSLATPSGVRGGNSSKEKLNGEPCEKSLKKCYPTQAAKTRTRREWGTHDITLFVETL